MSRLENAVKKTDLFRLGECVVDTFINSYSKDPSVIILDCDDTNRIQDTSVQKLMFKVLGFTEEEANSQFGFLELMITIKTTKKS